jgi:hypothetical protein
MSEYTKTTWNSGAAPGIDADKLNNLETQYDCAKDDLDDHVANADPHDQYPLKSILTTQGDIIYRGASGWTRLGHGGGGKVLTLGTNKPYWSVPYTGPTTQTDVTASREIGTVYQNTTGKPMWITVTYRADGNGTYDRGLRFYSDASDTPTTEIARGNLGHENIGASNLTTTIIVLPGNYYKAAQYSSEFASSITKWIEWY